MSLSVIGIGGIDTFVYVKTTRHNSSYSHLVEVYQPARAIPQQNITQNNTFDNNFDAFDFNSPADNDLPLRQYASDAYRSPGSQGEAYQEPEDGETEYYSDPDSADGQCADGQYV